MSEISQVLNLPPDFCLTQCMGACCNDNILRMNREEFDTYKVGVKITLVGDPEDISDMSHNQSRLGPVFGTFAAEAPYGYLVVNKGACPHKQSDNRCGIYDQRPNECRELKIGSQFCLESRRDYKVAPSTFIPSESIPDTKSLISRLRQYLPI